MGQHKNLFFPLVGLAVPIFLLLLAVSVSDGPYKPTPYVLEYPAYFGGRYSIPADNPLTEEGVLLGRMLFYESRLSKDNQISCAGCHQQHRAFTDGKALSKGVDGFSTKRNSMSLANLLWVRNFFWDGRASSLEAQAIFPLTDPHEMGQSLEAAVEKLERDAVYRNSFRQAFGTDGITPDRIFKALAQFERTLISADAPYDHYLEGKYTLTLLEAEGMQLFMGNASMQASLPGANCAHCHGTPKMYKELFHNNGLDKEAKDLGRMEFTGQETDRGRFRVPTLRNIAVTAPYMHDGRFATLEEVLDHYDLHIQASETLSPFLRDVSDAASPQRLMLKAEKKKAIIAFLHLLTDSTFLTRPDFANPHQE
jgi:cytochrome c peroxidase